MDKNYFQNMTAGQNQYTNKYTWYFDLERDHPL